MPDLPLSKAHSATDAQHRHQPGDVRPLSDAQPSRFRRRVLLAVSGLSPQIITETVYALAVAAPPEARFVPTEVQVITTAEGARQIQQLLLPPQGGGFARLCADFALPDIALGQAQLHIVAGHDGQPLDDIRSAADNACMADTITERVRALTADADCALHVSLAGGRKTMGFYAGYALSLFGREQDRLSHVLVAPPFESSREFFYPTPYPHPILLQGAQEQVDAATAQVTLAQIPFVRLRQGLPKALLQGRTSFAATVHAANASQGLPRMVLVVDRNELRADQQSIRLSPTEFALLAALAQRARTDKPALAAPLRDTHDRAWAEEVLVGLRTAVGVMQVNSRFEVSLRRECSGNKISPHLSRLRKKLHAALAPGRAALYFDDGAKQRQRRYRVPLPPDAIEIVASAARTASLQNTG